MIKRGQIFMVEFEPSTGHEYRGVRPAIVIQAAETDISPLITVIPLTSKTLKGYPSDVLIKKNEVNKLWHDSLALSRFISSFDRARFRNPDGSTPSRFALLRSIGSVKDGDLEMIDASLRVHLGL